MATHTLIETNQRLEEMLAGFTHWNPAFGMVGPGDGPMLSPATLGELRNALQTHLLMGPAVRQTRVPADGNLEVFTKSLTDTLNKAMAKSANELDRRGVKAMLLSTDTVKTCAISQ